MGLGTQFAIFIAIRAFDEAAVNIFVETALLSSIGLSVSKAGNNFRTIRQVTATRRPGEEWHTSGVKFVLALCVVVIASRLGASTVPLGAVLVGAGIGTFHNRVYRGFLARDGWSGALYAFLGTVHYALVYLGLKMGGVDTGQILEGGLLATLIAGALCVYLLGRRSDAKLGLGELAYTYAYPLTTYALLPIVPTSDRWWFFMGAKVTDGLSVIGAYIYQPALFNMEAARRAQWYRVAARWLLAVALISSAGAGAWLFESHDMAKWGAAWAALAGIAVAGGFQIVAPLAFIRVASTATDGEVARYGVLVCLVPLAIVLASVTFEIGWPGCAAVLLSLWAIHQPRGQLL
jgi:hypothetical protein